MVTADLPPFMKPGQRLDVTVSTMGAAKSLRGGTLPMTPMMGADGETYAVAQGNLVVGGLGVSGNDGSSVIVNVPTTAVFRVELRWNVWLIRRFSAVMSWC